MTATSVTTGLLGVCWGFAGGQHPFVVRIAEAWTSHSFRSSCPKQTWSVMRHGDGQLFRIPGWEDGITVNDTDNWLILIAGCWFGTFVLFPYIGNNNPNWLIFFLFRRGWNHQPDCMIVAKLYTFGFSNKKGMYKSKHIYIYINVMFNQENRESESDEKMIYLRSLWISIYSLVYQLT